MQETVIIIALMKKSGTADWSKGEGKGNANLEKDCIKNYSIILISSYNATKSFYFLNNTKLTHMLKLKYQMFKYLLTKL